VSVGEAVYFEVRSFTNEKDVGEVTSLQWDFDNDKQTDDSGTLVSFIFNEAGQHSVSLTLSNNDSPVVRRVLQLPITVNDSP
jgi:PKD repeat protein